MTYRTYTKEELSEIKGSILKLVEGYIDESFEGYEHYLKNSKDYSEGCWTIPCEPCDLYDSMEAMLDEYSENF